MPDQPTPQQPMSQQPMSQQPWTRLSRREVYANPWITVVEDMARVPNGHETIYGIVQCAEAVGVLPFVDDEHVLMVQQYRYVAGRAMWEMPTGGVHAGESLVDAAQRELAEEAGMRATSLDLVSAFHTSKSVVDETAHLFLATGLTPDTETPPDATELIERRIWRFDDVVDMVLRSEITDSMTCIAVLLADRRRRIT
jgi:ADP-ribose pyrophosphatase